ncbi:MAG: cytochrome c-type biosis protein CcmH [Pseudomonadota bacterium]|nr:cytochrome c-type biosis protein CcmH [Pseudomonadota bacterium]
MTTFISLATLMVVVAAALLAVPLLRAPRVAADTADRNATNLNIFRDQLAELEHEHSEGSLTAADFEQARTELQRRLLEDVKPASIASKEAAPSRKTALIIMILLPLVGLGGYGLLGNPRALDPANTQPQPRMSADQIEGMVEKLAERLKQNPDDPNGWVMLARSYKMMGRYAESAEAYGHATAVVEKDAMLLADYAEMLAISGDGFKGKPTELINKALKLAPEDPQTLLLAGAAAGERRDFKAAVAYWEKVMPQLEPGSEEAESLGAAIAQAKTVMQNSKSAAGGPRISGEVTLHPSLAGKVKPDDVLFIFARAEGGKGMPLAAIRQTAGQLPLRFSLDDSMSLAGGEKLSAHRSVTIEARIAKSGMAQTAGGDLFGRQTSVKAGTSGIKLVIDQVVP